ncbi:MAG: phosphoadenosine phosphosulfate reductase family protein [Pseudomonadota bacterium]
MEPLFSIWEAACNAKIGIDNLCAQSHDLTKYGFIKLLDDKRKALNCDGVFLGLRMLEGQARKMNLATRGPIYQLKDKSWRCNPLWRWSAKDVFAYLVNNEVEINPCYLYNKFLQPEDIRLSWALPTATGMSREDMAHIRYYYPEHYRRLRDVGVATVS